MDAIESINDLAVQDPPGEDFYSADLIWKKLGNGERYDDVALIPYERVDAFIIGECLNVECPTRFHIERGRKRVRGSLKEFKDDEYLEYRIYWCSFGPENYGGGGDILPSRRYHLNTRNRAARPQSMRGCTCHFIVKRLYACPSLALLMYNEKHHVNKSGFVCHGPLDRDAIGPGAKKIPYVCSEIQQQTMSMIYLGIPEENVLEKHIEGIQRYCGPDEKVKSLASQYVQKLGMIIKRSTHELDLDDQASIRLWVERNNKSTFFYRDMPESDPFLLGIQTEWQLQQMIRFGHQNFIGVDSTFGIKRLKNPLCTVLVFDSRQHALPVAWVITRSIAKPDVTKWMKAQLDRVHSVDPGWKANGFLIDDAAAEIDPIIQNLLLPFSPCLSLFCLFFPCSLIWINCFFREIFSCPKLFSLWRVRRSWLRHIVKKCSNIEVQREICKRLGQIVYSIWGGMDLSAALEDFCLDFVDQVFFVQYFKASWIPKIEMWLSSMKTLPIASQEASGAVEAYHVKLKTKLYDDSHLGSLQRVDWLVHKLTTELHSSYWLDRFADESDSFQNMKDEYIASTSWHRALQIPDSFVTIDDKDRLFAKVLSKKDISLTRVVWNPRSEFAHCDCEWSLLGNLCRHVIKVNMICENMQRYLSSMSFQSYKNILTDIWEKPMDDSVDLDISTAWTYQMLDQIQKLVELNNSADIGDLVNNMPLKWLAKKARTACSKPPSTLALHVNSKSHTSNAATHKKGRKRKRLSRLR